MKNLARSAAIFGLVVIFWVAWTLKDIKSAQAQQQVEATRAQIASVQDLAAVYKAVGKIIEPSVVRIDVTKTVKNPAQRFHEDDLLRRFFPDRDGDGEPDVPDFFRFEMPDMPEQFQQQGTGSGVIVQVDGDVGYIVTNNHVAGHADEMEVTLADGRRIKNAKLVGADPKSDLAVIKIEADRLVAAQWGDSDKLEKGDIVIAFGSPFGYSGSMTHGIVSALGRNEVGIISSEFRYENFIQTDAAINPGNSGGPLVNLSGEVVGINTAIASRSGGFQGIGFAIPSKQARFVYEAIRNKGKVVRGWLGVGIKDVSKFRDEAASQGWNQDSGVIVQELFHDTPASGKLKAGDIIIAVDGRKVQGVQELREIIAATAPGTTVKLTIFRDGKEQEVSVKLGEQPDDVRAMASSRGGRQRSEQGQAGVEALGVRLATFNEELARKYDLDPSLSGAVITAVKPGSLAQRVGLRAGDVITRIDQTIIETADDASEALADKDLSKGVKLYVTSREGSKFIFVKSDQK